MAVRILRRTPILLAWVLGLLLVLFGLLILLHPPLVKWAVARYSPEHTGRRITLDHFRLNPFNGNIEVRGLQVLEAAADTVFLKVDTINVDLTLYKILTGTYEVTSVRVARPFLRIVQHGERFNFSDLLDRFTGDTAAPAAADTMPVHWSVSDLALVNGELTYLSDLLPFPMHVADMDLSSPGLAWDRDRVESKASVRLRNGARLRTEVSYEQRSMRYDVHARIDSTSLRFIEPYVAPYMRIGKVGGILEADLHVQGNGGDPLDVRLAGELHLRDPSLTDPAQVVLFAAKDLEVVVDSIDVQRERYRMKRITVDEPYLLFELYDQGDNWTRLLPVDSAASDSTSDALGYDPMNPFSMLAYYVKLVSEDYDALDYRVDTFGIVNGKVEFNDHTLQNTFRYTLTDLSLSSSSIDSRRDSITLVAHAALNGTGTFDARLDLDPNSLRNLHLRYDIVNLGMPDFGPYTTFFLAHPILSGTTYNHCETSIVDNKLQSINHVRVEDFHFGRRMDIGTAYQLPVRLAVSLLKDKDGNIELEFPVEGDLDDPEYRVMPIVWQVLKNLVVKAVSAPANLLARSFGAEDEEDLKSVRFLYLQEDLTARQKKPLDLLVRVAKAKPELRIELVQAGDRLGEAEAQALLLARKAYLADSLGKPVDLPKIELEEVVARIDIKTPGFGAWLDKQLGPSGSPVQERCMQLAGNAALNAEVERLHAARITLIKAYLQQEHSLSPDRILVREATSGDTLPASGQPYFEMRYANAEGD